jgi:hypothetical protein
MKTQRKVFALAVILALAGACGSGPTTPSSGLEGTWAGTITSSQSGAGTVQLVFSSANVGVQGTWTAHFGAAESHGAASSPGAVTSPIAVSFNLDVPLACVPGAFPGGNGALSLLATLAGNRLSGNYTSLRCTDSDSGTIDLTRQ